jgi:hypothetical protein
MVDLLMPLYDFKFGGWLKGPLSSVSIEALFTNGEKGMYFDPSDTATLFRSPGSATLAGVGDPLGRILDKSGNGNHITQPTFASRPTHQLEGGVHWIETDGVDDSIGVAFPAGTLGSAMTVFAAVSTTDTQGMLFNASDGPSGRYLGAFQEGDTSPLINSTVGLASEAIVDDAVMGSREDVYLALADGLPHLVEIRYLDLSTWSGFYLSGFNSSWKVAGNYGPVIVAETAAVASVGRDKIIAALKTKVGLT